MSLEITRRGLLVGAATTAGLAGFRINIARSQETPIKIGFPVPLSGPYATEAQDQVRCAKLAIDFFNANSPRKAELVVRDDKLNPGEGATRALELIESEKVNFLCGSLSAAVQLSVNQVASKRGVIYNSISQSDKINEASDRSKYTFHEALNPYMTAGAVARYVLDKNPDKKRIAYLIADYAFGEEMMRGFQQVAKERGLDEVAVVRHPLGTTDYSTFFPRLQAARPDILAVVNFGRDQLNTLKQATDFGLKQQMQIVYPVLLDTQRFAGGFEPFQGVIGGTNYYWTLEDEYESTKKFNAAYRKAYDQGVPSSYGAYGFAGVAAILDGVKHAGSTNEDDVIKAMVAMTYDPYKGPETYRACDHQAIQSVLIVEAKPESKMRDKNDIFEILAKQPADAKYLRSCQELGYPA